MHTTKTTTEAFVPTSNAHALRIRDIPLEEVVVATLPGPAPAEVEIPPLPAAAPALNATEVAVLREAVQRQIHALMSEVAGTESHALQHGIAQTITQLEGIARKLASATAPATKTV